MDILYEPRYIMINQLYINRYNNFIESRKNRIIPNETYVEIHHIIPVSLGGLSDKENLIVLTAREHYIAHWILSKAYHGKMDYAFWMMNLSTNDKHKRYKNSYIYEKEREYISEKLSKSMKGRIYCIDLETKNVVLVSLAEYYQYKDIKFESINKGKSVYIINGVKKRLSTNDPRIESGEAVHYRTNYHHKQSTIEKMKKNGIHNRKLITNLKTNELKYINPDEDVPDGWIYGYTPEQLKEIKEQRQKTFKKVRWITDGQINKRLDLSLHSLPEGWKIGRTLKKDEKGVFIKNEEGL